MTQSSVTVGRFKGKLVRLVAQAVAIEVERGFLWAPLLTALGIIAYFAARVEPPFWVCLSACALCLMCGATARVVQVSAVRAAFWAAALLGLGFCAAALRTHMVAAPVLDHRYYGPVEGRVVGLDRSASGALRVTLDQVRLGRRTEQRLPVLVRISLFGADAEARPAAGTYVMTTAHLSPPNGPAEPNGFDFRRHAWFQQIGGVGYTRHPLLLARRDREPPAFFALRLALSDRILSQLPGQTGAFATALMTGDRSALTPDTLRALRQTNLAHLLAISGLHMGLLAGFVFTMLRAFMACNPQLAHGALPKKLAAGGALIVAALYLGLSGGSVATERAFIMAAVALGAVILDRRAMSLRAVALAAMIVMLRQPDAILGPGFQMSFAATTALVVVFRILSDRVPAQTARHWAWRVASGAVISSAVAGLATLPIAAAHFNQIAHYGLIANVVSVPLMGLWIMPLAVVAVCLIPLGLDGAALRAVGAGLDWILAVAHEVAGWDGAVRKIPAPDSEVFGLMCLGLVILAVSATRLRIAGGVAVAVAVSLWTHTERPDILIADTGSLVGVLHADGRALSKAKGAGFVAGIWLENDGDAAGQDKAAGRWAGSDGVLVRSALDAGVQVIAVKGKRGAAAFAGCTAQDIAVFSENVPSHDLPCLVFDKAKLRVTGSVAVWRRDSGHLDIQTARTVTGRRLWTSGDIRAARAEGLRNVWMISSFGSGRQAGLEP